MFSVPIRLNHLAEYAFQQDRIKKSDKELKRYLPFPGKKAESLDSHSTCKSLIKNSKQETAYDTTVLETSQPIKTYYPDIENGLHAVNHKEIVKHKIAKKPIKRRSVCYISDLHIENQIDLIGKTATEVELLLQPKVSKLAKTIDEASELIVFTGDISSSLQLTKRFLHLFASWRTVLFIPGNHELFQPLPSNNTQACQNAALEVFRNEVKTDAVVLQNELFICHKAKKNFIITEHAILESSIDELRHVLDECSIIVLGGTGYAGNNPDSPGCFMLQSDERECSARFRTVYDKVLAAAGDKKVIIATHMPIHDWSDYPYQKGWIYISGHTHRNQLLIEKDITVLADNQIGNKKGPWRFKSFTIDAAWDPVSKLPDGIHKISHDAYDAFNRNRDINATLSRDGQCYCLKRATLYMFIFQTGEKRYLLNGGQIISLEHSVEYYYDNMKEYAKRVKRLFKSLNTTLNEISSIVKLYGGDGYIHGSIVDVDWYNHIFLDPAGAVTFYYAEKKGDWKCFDSFECLLKSKNLMFIPKRLGSKNKNALAQISNETKVLMLSTKEINLATVKTTKESYARSRVVSKIGYLNKHNVIRIWNDAVMQDETELIQSPNNKLLNN